MEESDEFKWALKVVIKRQMRDLIEQLRENGEEIAIISADLTEEQCTHFGSPKGEWFMSEQRNLTSSFLKFCKHKTSKDTESAPKKPPAEAGAHGSASSQKLPSGMMSPRVVMEKLDGGPEDLDRCLMRVWVPADVIFAPGIADTDIVAVFGQLLTSRLSGAVQEAGDSPVKAGRGTKKTRSGRTVSSSFSDAVGTLTRRGRRQTQQNADASELSQEVIKRFEYSTVTGEPVDVEAGHSVNADQLQALTDAINPALDNLVSTNKLAGVKDKPVKVIVGKSCLRSEVQIDFDAGQSCAEEEDHKPDMSVDHDDSDLDMDVHDVDDFEEDLDDDRDSDFKPDTKTTAKHTGPFDYEAIIKGASKSNKSKDTATSIVVNQVVSQRIEHKMKQMKAIKDKKKRMARAKKAKDPQMMACELCGIELAGGLRGITAHVNRVHKKIRNFKCPICQKAFYSSTSLENHTLSIHTRKCDGCNQYVVETEPWADGITPKTVREKACVCGGTVTLFSRIGVFKGYRRNTENDLSEEEDNQEYSPLQPKRYPCDQCGRLYPTKSDRKKHAQRQHSTQKSVMCDVCGAELKNMNVLNGHKAKQHGIYKYPCEVCGVNYNSEQALKVHMSRAHPRPKLVTENENGEIVKVEKPVENVTMEKLAENTEDSGMMDPFVNTVLTTL